MKLWTRILLAFAPHIYRKRLERARQTRRRRNIRWGRPFAFRSSARRTGFKHGQLSYENKKKFWHGRFWGI